MRHRYKAGLAFAAGIAALGLACGAASAATPDAAAPADDETAGEEGQARDTSAPPPSTSQRGEAQYTLGPLTGEPGPGWSSHIGGAPMMGVGVPGTPARYGSGLPPAFGAGLGGPQPFDLGPLPGGAFGAWSPSLGIGPRAYRNVMGGD